VESIDLRDRQLTQVARHDALTGLPNRYHLLGQLGQRIDDCRAQGDRLALMFIDLDRFKNINDTLGHSVGDELLRRVSSVLQKQARGDEFVVLVRDAGDVRLSAERLAGRLIGALRVALARGEFVLHYQPRVRLDDRRIVGCEALVRWDRPGHGLQAPGLFVPLMQEIGLMQDLNLLVVEAACRQLGQWLQAGVPAVPMAVNLTPEHCLLPGFADTLLACCGRHGVPHDMFEIEIVETTLLEEREAVQENLRVLRNHGVRVAVGDSGTGYSALSYLHRFEIDFLKIDRSFVASIGDRHGDAPMTRAIALIGHSLSLGVIAEGVETEHQARVLASHGCEFAQGYLFGRPEPADVLEALLRRQAVAACA